MQFYLPAFGSGKTFQARKILDHLLGKEGYVYLSLNGISRREELDEALFAAIYPWTTNKGVRIGTAVAKAALKHAKVDLPELKTSDLVARAASSTFVFDDLERCRLPIEESMGFINGFVERDGRKVIIITDETRLVGNGTYSGIKEKVVGKSVAVAADFEAAMAHFAEQIESETAEKPFKRFGPEIEAIYRQSALQNLRILEQTMADFARVTDALGPELTQNDGAMRALVMLFFALSFEQRSGRISGDDLRDRMSKIVKGMFKNEEPTPLSLASARYSGLELADSILSDDVLFDILVNGIIDPQQIRASFEGSSWFAHPDEPTWRAVWHSYDRKDDEAERTASNLVREFLDRKYNDAGEILHVFGLMLWLSDLGVTGWDRPRTLSECKSYVDELRQAHRLEPTLRGRSGEISSGSYAGLGFHQSDTPEFKQVADYLSDQRVQAGIDRYPEEADKLTALASNDPTEFTREIAYSSGGRAAFADVPVFTGIDPAKFADKLIELDPMVLRQVLSAFSSRYEAGALTHRLKDERRWAAALQKELLTRASKLNAFGRTRVESMTKYAIGKHLADVEEVEKQQASDQNS